MLDEVILTNFKGFKSATIPLAPLTLLSGLNSSGKSTVLQSLGVLRQSLEAGFLDDGSWLLNGPFVELGLGSDVLHEDSDVEELGIGFVQDGARFAWTVSYSQQADVLETNEISKVTASSAVPFSDRFHFLRADRVNPQTISAKSRHAVSQNRSLGAKGEFAAHFLAIFRDQPVPANIRHPEAPETTPGLLNQVNAWMQEFSPGVRVDVHDVAGTDFVRLSFTFGSGISESNAYRPTNVGFGVAYSLPIVIACLATPADGLVLLENPEAHLHPRGQMAMGRLVALAASAGIQLLVETHSDHLLNGVRLAVKRGELAASDVKMHFFNRDPALRQSNFVSPGMQSDGRLTFWPEGFFDQWDRALMDLVG
jgi:predicted ATPase